VERLRERLREERLGDPGDALEEDVAADGEGEPAEPDRLLLADDGLGDLGAERFVEVACCHLRAIG